MTRCGLGSILLLVGACGGTTPGDTPRGSADFGSLGGRLDSDDGSASLEIPAGALSAETRVTFRAVPADRGGFVGAKTWSISFGGAMLATPVRLSLPCAGCKGDERLGQRGTAGVVPLAAPSEVLGDRLNARVGNDGVYGATACAHKYCFAGEIVEEGLRLTWEGPGATVDGHPSPLLVPVEIGGEPRTFTVEGPDGFDELVAILDPDALPSHVRISTGLSGAVRVRWEPSLFPGASVEVRRFFCGEPGPTFTVVGAGLTDAATAPGSRYTYEIARAGATLEVSARAESTEAACVFRPLTCELGVPLEDVGQLPLAIEPTLQGSERYVIGLGDESESLAGFAAPPSFGPATTTGESTIAVEGIAGAEGQRLIWIEAQVAGRDGVCRAPLRLRAFEATKVVAIDARDAAEQPIAPEGLKVRVLDRAWVTLEPVASGASLRVPVRDGGRYSVAVACDANATRVVSATLDEIDGVSPRCPGAELAEGLASFDPVEAPACQRLTIAGGATSACVSGTNAIVAGRATFSNWVATRHANAEALPSLYAFGSTQLGHSAIVPVSFEGALPATPRDASVHGAAEPFTAEVAFLYGGARVIAGGGGATFQFGSVASFGSTFVLDVRAANERWVAWSSGDANVVADLETPFPDVSLSLEGKTLSGTLPAGVIGVLVEDAGTQFYVSAQALAHGDVLLDDPFHPERPGAGAAITIYQAEQVDVETLFGDPSLSFEQRPGARVRARRLR
jgi:hypothetical protein